MVDKADSRLTDTRLRILEYIAEWMESHRYAPTREEIRQGVGLKVRSSVQYHIESLVADGFLERDVHGHRLIRLTKQGRGVIATLKEIDETDNRHQS